METLSDNLYQQSSPWASNKIDSGWKFLRLVVREHARIVGGVKILLRKYRKTRRLHMLNSKLLDIKSEDLIPLADPEHGGHLVSFLSGDAAGQKAQALTLESSGLTLKYKYL